MESNLATTFEDWKLVLLTNLGTPGLVLVGAAAVLALGLAAWSYRHQRRLGVRLGLTLARLLSVAAVVLIVLQPAVQLRNVTRLPNHVAVLVDLSRSMAVREQADGSTRLQRTRSLLRASEGRIRDWRAGRVVSMLSFGADLKPLPVSRELEATEQATRIHKALSELVQQYRGKDLAAAVLISDGIDNGRLGSGKLTEASQKFLRSLGFPVHTVWVGSGKIRDLAVAEIYADHFGFVRNAMRLEVELVVLGMELGTLPVTLRTGGVVVARKLVSIKKGRSRYRVKLEFVPQEVGKYVYTVEVPLHASEAVAENNRRSFVLKVIRDRIRVLQLCGRPSWDERFLRRLLKRDPNVDLISFFILRTQNDVNTVNSSELSLIPFPTEELFLKELGSFDLVLLQNFDYGPYGIGSYLPNLARYVRQGGGLVMIGGDRSFTSGGYADSVLAPVLPVRLLPASDNLARLVSVEEFRPRVTARGRDHPILQVGHDRAGSLRVLGSLPAFTGVNLVAGPAAGATVLLGHPFLKDASGRPMPVLAAGEAGKGRTLALTTDTSWHWAFRAVGQGGTRQAYDRFWRNAIRWLIRDPELKYLRVIAQKDRVRQGAPVKIVVRAFNPDYSAAEGVQVTYEIRRLPKGKGRQSVAATDSRGEVRLELSPSARGAYAIRATAEIAGRRNTERTVVLVDPTGPEDREPAASDKLLREISRVTGGKHLGRPKALPNLAFRQPRVLQVNWRRDEELWNRWWFLLLAVTLLGAEWLLRRKFGYL